MSATDNSYSFLLGPLDEAAMLSMAAKLANALPEKLVIYLTGDLGAGKTTFSRGLIQGLGHQGAVKSPTFTLVEPYNVDGREVFHFDLYRLSDPEELDYIGASEYFCAHAWQLIEWPSCGEGFIPEADLHIHLIRHGSDARQLELTVKGGELKQLVDRLLSA